MKKKIEMRKCENVTVGQAFEYFIRKCIADNLSDYTIKAYKKKCAEFIDMVGEDTMVSEIGPHVIDEFVIDVRERDISDITVQTIVRHVRAFVYYCMDCGYVTRFKIRVPKADKPLKDIYTREELITLLFTNKPNVRKCSFSEYKTWVFEKYLYGTGNRLSTALNVKIKDIDFENYTIRLMHNKNRKQQIIPLSPDLAVTLQEYLQYRGGEADDYLFCNEYGEQASDRTYQQLVRRYNIKRNVNRTSCHSFRHTFATEYIRNNGNVVRLQKIMGHASLSTTNEYLQMLGLDVQSDFDAFSPLDNLVGRR